EPPRTEVLRRWLPPIAPTAAIAATLLIAAIAMALVRNRSKGAAPAPDDRAMQPTLQGDVTKPVTLPTPSVTRDTHEPREAHDTRDAHKTVRPDTNRVASIPTSATQRPAPAPDTTSRPSITIPGSISKLRIAVSAVPPEKSAASNPSENSVWGGPAPLKP